MIDEKTIPLTRAEESGAKQAILVRAAARIALVAQWAEGSKCLFIRHPTKGLELPGGALEAGETPEQAGRRELMEEAGVVLRAEHPLPLIDMVPITDHRSCNWLDIIYGTEVLLTQLTIQLKAELPVSWLTADEIKQQVNPALSSYAGALAVLMQYTKI